jgi:hypothetical protein
MPDRKPKMHMLSLFMTCTWSEWSFGICNLERVRPTERTTEDWDKVTCGNCLRGRPKGETDGQ